MTKSEQARADAMADAETLRRFAWEMVAEHNRGLRRDRRINGRVAARAEAYYIWQRDNLSKS